jgi:hemerythrin
MPDAIYIIDKIIAEHHKIRDNLKLAGDSLNDVEASFLISNAFSGWTQASVAELATRKDHLMQALSALIQGLTTHFGYEEKYLPPLFGDLLMQALIYEHRGAFKQMEIAKKTVTDLDVDHLDARELQKEKVLIQDNISQLMQSIEEHAGHEEVILNMIKKSLQSADKP